MRYLLYYNDCHFACRFNSLQAEKSGERKNRESNFLFAKHNIVVWMAFWGSYAKKKKAPAQYKKVDFCFREVFFLLFLLCRFRFLYLNSPRLLDSLKRNRQTTNEETRRVKKILIEWQTFEVFLTFRPQVMFLSRRISKSFVN